MTKNWKEKTMNNQAIFCAFFSLFSELNLFFVLENRTL